MLLYNMYIMSPFVFMGHSFAAVILVSLPFRCWYMFVLVCTYQYWVDSHDNLNKHWKVTTMITTTQCVA